MRAAPRLAVGAAIVVLAGAVVLAHSAAADDHMGEAIAACVAVMDAAALGVLAVLAGRVLERVGRGRILGPSARLDRPAARHASVPPWPRGSPFALQVLRL